MFRLSVACYHCRQVAPGVAQRSGGLGEVNHMVCCSKSLFHEFPDQLEMPSASEKWKVEHMDNE